MIAFLEGVIAIVEPEGVVLNVHGVGYRVASGKSLGEADEQVRLYIVEVIREDKYDLYGFRTREELAFFQRLISIDGVGPKMAQKILAAGTEAALRSNIQAGDLGFLTSISGVGKKTAQKIILELKGVLVDSEETMSTGENDLLEALLSLGYQRPVVVAILPKITGEKMEERMKMALQLLGRTR